MRHTLQNDAPADGFADCYLLGNGALRRRRSPRPPGHVSRPCQTSTSTTLRSGAARRHQGLVSAPGDVAPLRASRARGRASSPPPRRGPGGAAWTSRVQVFAAPRMDGVLAERAIETLLGPLSSRSLLTCTRLRDGPAERSSRSTGPRCGSPASPSSWCSRTTRSSRSCRHCRRMAIGNARGLRVRGGDAVDLEWRGPGCCRAWCSTPWRRVRGDHRRARRRAGAHQAQGVAAGRRDGDRGGAVGVGWCRTRHWVTRSSPNQARSGRICQAEFYSIHMTAPPRCVAGRRASRQRLVGWQNVAERRYTW